MATHAGNTHLGFGSDGVLARWIAFSRAVAYLDDGVCVGGYADDHAVHECTAQPFVGPGDGFADHDRCRAGGSHARQPPLSLLLRSCSRRISSRRRRCHSRAAGKKAIF